MQTFLSTTGATTLVLVAAQLGALPLAAAALLVLGAALNELHRRDR